MHQIITNQKSNAFAVFAKIFLSFVLLMCFTALSAQAQEICSDGIDNDGDGFVDFYDPDCACEDGNFFGICTSECLYTAGFSDFALE